METIRRLGCLIAGLYGVGLGVFSLPTAVFVGPHALIGTVGHIAVGACFLLAAKGIRQTRLWGDVLMLVCSMTSGAVGLAATIGVATGDERDALVFWIPFCAFFASLTGMALCALYASRWRATRARQT